MDPLNQILNTVAARSAGVYSVLLCSHDGRPISHVGDQPMVEAMSAITASSTQLGRRLAEVLGPSELDELTVRSGDGYVIMYTISHRCVLTVMAGADANLALTHLAVREIAPQLIEHLDAPAVSNPDLPVPVVATAPS